MNEIMNPFEMKTPDTMSADDAVDLFVDVFSDFKQILEKSHTFINGPRGCGKSMMFRYMMPDCQEIVSKQKEIELIFFAIYVPIKNANVNILEIGKLEDYVAKVFNEHFLSVLFLGNIFLSFKNAFKEKLNDFTEELRSFYNNDFSFLLKMSGYSKENKLEEDLKGYDILFKIQNIIEEVNLETHQYFKRIALSIDNNINYNGCLFDFLGIIFPIIKKLKEIFFTEIDIPVYILVDDAGYLSRIQTQVLNTWVSYRTTKDVCFKISTQLDYKSYLTIGNKRIDSPHDYSEINISTIYASSKSLYNNKVREIVKKRIKKYTNINIVNIDEYFPEDEDQKKQKAIISEELKIRNYNENKPWAGGDAAARYTTSEYLKKLKSKRSGSSYSYSGFDVLVSISSGIVRHFLAPAQEMYSLQYVKDNNPPEKITDSVQNEIIRKHSSNFLNDEFDKRKIDDVDSDLSDKLYMLINSLGEFFHNILMSDASERKVFSIALNDIPSDELKKVLDLAEQSGYLHKSTIGSKNGLGRKRLYILTRILSPHFRLDPTSFAGYKFMDSSTLELGMYNTNKFLKKALKEEDKEDKNQQELNLESDENIEDK